jgi:hypothetical protein
VNESPVAQYLDQLERELRIRRVPRGRLLAEAADHLHAAADETLTSGTDRVEAERQAVEHFGAAAIVARRFAHAVTSTGARTALAWTTAAYAAYAAAACVFVVAAPSWLRDFPQGAPSMLGLQVATVALAVSGLRAFRDRSALVIDEPRLRLIANGLVVASLALACSAGCELLLALTRPAAAPWPDAAAVIVAWAVGAAVTLVAAFFAAGTLGRARLLATLPRPRDRELSIPAASLVDDVAATAPPLRPLAVLVTARPLVACATTATAAFLVLAGIDAGREPSTLAGAAATGLFEAAAVVVAYLGLSRTLGLRASRRPR